MNNANAKECLAGKAGKLRLMHEANPLSFIVEQSGGAASTGHDAPWTSSRKACASACR